MLVGIASSTCLLFLTNARPIDEWFLSGGSSTLPQAMFVSLSKTAREKAQFKSLVTAISCDVGTEVMRILINGVQSTQEYSAIFSTVPLPHLSLMDLSGDIINGNYAQWSAICELQYGPVIKIGIKFCTLWWGTSNATILQNNNWLGFMRVTLTLKSHKNSSQLIQSFSEIKTIKLLTDQM